MKQKIVRILHIFVKKFHLENLIIFISNILNLKTWKTLPQNIYYEDSDCKKITKDKVIFSVNRYMQITPKCILRHLKKQKKEM